MTLQHVNILCKLSSNDAPLKDRNSTCMILQSEENLTNEGRVALAKIDHIYATRLRKDLGDVYFRY